MPCPYHDDRNDEPSASADDDGDDPNDRGVDRREFMKSALVIGGGGALSTVAGLYGMPESAAAEDGPPSAGERLNRQHAWDAYERVVPERNQTVPPEHHLLLHVDYLGDGAPDPEDRREVERALDLLEAAFGWNHEGLLFVVGYSPAYFDRFDRSLPPGLEPDAGGLEAKQGLVRPDPLIDATSLDREDPAAETHDAVVHLASDHVGNLLAAEEVLWGERDSVHGVEFDATFEGIFDRPTEYPARRTGFVGHDNLETSPFPDRETGEEREDGIYPDDIPEAANLSMGFDVLFENSVPRETGATILEDQKLVEPKPPGAFAQGTVLHVSKLDVDIDDWYADNDLDERRAQMFSPHHDEDNTGTVGENLGSSNAPGDRPMRDVSSPDRDVAEATVEDARSEGVVGHTQKLARTRFDLESRLTDEGVETYRSIDRYDAATAPSTDLPGHDGPQEAEQVILRRDFDTTDQDRAGVHFVGLMRFNPYMAYARAAMNGVEFDTSTFGLPTGEDQPGFVHEDLREHVTGEDKAGFVNPDGEGNEDNGIVPYLTTRRRGNYLAPPITLRALPPARAVEPDIEVERRGNVFFVTVEGAGELEDVQFGHYLDVNRARGASPVAPDGAGPPGTFRFRADETNLDPGDTARFVAKRTSDRAPVRATATAPGGPGGGPPGNGGDGSGDDGGSPGNDRGGAPGNGGGPP